LNLNLSMPISTEPFNVRAKEIIFCARASTRAFKEAIRKVRPAVAIGMGCEFSPADDVMTIGLDRKSSRSYATLPADGEKFSVVVPRKAVTQFAQ